jgi:hypothetical protein
VGQPRSHPSPLARARPLPLERGVVLDCVDVEERPQDVPFVTAFEQTLQALEPAMRRGALAGITGHVAESVAEVMLESLGWTPVWHFVGPGRHGVDLLLLGPSAERLFAVEVKGTLRPRHWPRLRRAELTQMAVEWLDKADNPALSEWDVASEDVYGAIVLVNFHDLFCKVALTSDFITWRPLDRLEQLEELEWARQPNAPIMSRLAESTLKVSRAVVLPTNRDRGLAPQGLGRSPVGDAGPMGFVPLVLVRCPSVRPRVCSRVAAEIAGETVVLHDGGYACSVMGSDGDGRQLARDGKKLVGVPLDVDMHTPASRVGSAGYASDE